MSHALKSRLESALIRHDRLNAERAARSKHGYHNPHALALYLQRLDDVIAEIDAGADPVKAIESGFNDKVRTVCLKALQVTT